MTNEKEQEKREYQCNRSASLNINVHIITMQVQCMISIQPLYPHSYTHITYWDTLVLFIVDLARKYKVQCMYKSLLQFSLRSSRFLEEGLADDTTLNLASGSLWHHVGHVDTLRHLEFGHLGLAK